MNAEDTRTAEPDQEFDPRRLRTITDMKRSRDDRLLGGVCSGAAKYLDIDPVIVRVVIAVLTVAGFAGVILYAAAWFFVPAEDEERSIAAEWFKLDRNEPQVRVAALVGAGILAAVAVVGDNGYAWWGVPWFLVPLGLLYYVFAVRPRRRRESEAAYAAAYAPPGTPPESEAERAEAFAAEKTRVITEQAYARAGLAVDRKLAKASRPRSPALTLLTLSVAAIAVAATRLWAEFNDGAPAMAYVAVALGVVALGLLVSTVVGDGGLLIGVGAILAIVLAIGSALPSGRIGAQQPSPETAAQVEATYTHGVGLLELDLTDVKDPQDLVGRTIRLEAGVGQTKVVVPDGLNVSVVSRLKAGEISAFGRKENGTDVSVDQTSEDDTAAALTIDIDQKIGNIEVISR